MDNIAVIIPCYNEEWTIKKVILDCKKYLKDAKIYVYDNNSTDDSVNIAKEAGAIVRYEYKQGKGNVVREMFRDINAKCYLLVDADDTYSLTSAKMMCDYVLNDNYDMVIGDRLSSTYFKENKRKFHNFGNVLVCNLINKFFKSDVKDVMTGFRCMSYEFVKTFPVLSKGFEIETEMTIHAVYNNLNVKSVVVDYKDRPKESPSKLNTVSDGFKVIGEILKLYKDYKPFSFFTFIAFVLFVIATIYFVPVLMAFMKTGRVDKFPTLIVSGYVYIAALLTFFVGLILSTIAENERKHFEENYHTVKMMKDLERTSA